MIQKRPEYYTNPRDELYQFAGRAGLSLSGPVLNIGCGAGADGPILRKFGATEIHGVEPVGEAAQVARGEYDRVDACRLDEWTWDGTSYQLVVCADVLEHLADPKQALLHIRSWLADDGRLLVSIPNVRHLSVLWMLLVRGDWRYEEAGIMDSTHLAFFTRRSFIRLLQETNYRITATTRWGTLGLTRRIETYFPGSGEFLLSLIFFLASRGPR